jgi:hypothetical protein
MGRKIKELIIPVGKRRKWSSAGQDVWQQLLSRAKEGRRWEKRVARAAAR